MNGKTKSILLQVAYKGVVESGREVNAGTVKGDFELLLGLHTELGIDADEGAPARRTNTGWNGGSSSAPSVKVEGVRFNYEGVAFEDFRGAKELGALKATYPDFKTVSGQEVPGITNDRGSAWMFDQNNNAIAALLPLVTEADKAAVIA